MRLDPDTVLTRIKQLTLAKDPIKELEKWLKLLKNDNPICLCGCPFNMHDETGFCWTFITEKDHCPHLVGPTRLCSCESFVPPNFIPH